MLKFPRKEEGKKEKKRKEGEKKGKKGREEGERKKARKVKGQKWVVYWGRRRKCVKKCRSLACYQQEKYFFGPCRPRPLAQITHFDVIFICRSVI